MSNNIEKNKTLYQLLQGNIAVPDYQRDYAQGRINDKKIEDTRLKFIDDIIAAACGKSITHMGLVYGSANSTLKGFVAVDGQQRLTTAYLFHLYLAKRLGRDVSEELSRCLSHFGWHGRMYASEFTELLLSFDNWSEVGDSLGTYLRESANYFTVWEKDPTVNNMLVMLDAIHGKLKNASSDFLLKMANNLVSDKCGLVFDYMLLDKDTDEFLYQKMNSRGRDLTTYELFKQKFQSEVTLSEAFKTKIDNSWLCFFDSKASVLNLETDVCYQNYINETALFLGIRNTNDNFFYVSAIEDSKLKGNRTDVGFIPFEAYSELVKNKDLVERIFDWITINFDYVESVVASLEYKGETNQLLSIFNIPTWSVRVFNYAIVQYAQKTDFSLVDKDHFWLWWRLVHNLIANTNIDSNNIFNIIKKIDEVPAEGIEDYLMEAKEEYFNIFQFKEEKLKISLSRGNRELISVFTNLEKDIRFKGQISMLLPDEETITADEMVRIAKNFECLVAGRYDASIIDFSFVRTCLTFYVEEDGEGLNKVFMGNAPSHFRLEDGFPAVFIKRMFRDYLHWLASGKGCDAGEYLVYRDREWMKQYDELSYDRKKMLYWVKFLYANGDMCKEYFDRSRDKTFLVKVNGDMACCWLYHKSYRNEEDILIGTRRKEVIEACIPGVENASLRHEGGFQHPIYKYLFVYFDLNGIWFGIRQNSDCEVKMLPENTVCSSANYKAWRWFKSLGELNYYYEHEGEALADYLVRLKEEFDIDVKRFLQQIGVNLDNFNGR